jgi:hypothetical protein
MIPIRRPPAELLTVFAGALAMDRIALEGAAGLAVSTPTSTDALGWQAARREEPIGSGE